MPPPEPWATLRIVLDPPVSDPALQADAADRLEELGTMIAWQRLVGGVETRDRTTVDAPASPELWAYTVPEGLEGLERQIVRLADRLELCVALQARTHNDDAWRDAWREFYPPLVLGKGDKGSDGAILLRPSWVDRRPGDPELEVVIDPGRAFGTGLHASTRLCLDHLCHLAAAAPHFASRMLDLGCGSGILTLVAARLWCADLVAVDVDPEATATTRENLARNGLDHRVHVVTGSLEDAALDLPFDLIVANIRPGVLVPLAPILARHRAPQGVLLLGGILDEEADGVTAAYAAAGLPETVRRSRDGWCMLQMGGQQA